MAMSVGGGSGRAWAVDAADRGTRAKYWLFVGAASELPLKASTTPTATPAATSAQAAAKNSWERPDGEPINHSFVRDGRPDRQEPQEPDDHVERDRDVVLTHRLVRMVADPVLAAHEQHRYLGSQA